MNGSSKATRSAAICFRTEFNSGKLRESQSRGGWSPPKDLVSLGRKIDCAVNLVANSEVLVERISGRRVCKTCGESYHIKNQPPDKEGLCSSCGGELYQRDDDTEATVKTRVSVYEAQTAPLIDFYRGRKVLKNVDGTLGIDEIFSEISKLLA